MSKSGVSLAVTLLGNFVDMKMKVDFLIEKGLNIEEGESEIGRAHV